MTLRGICRQRRQRWDIRSRRCRCPCHCAGCGGSRCLGRCRRDRWGRRGDRCRRLAFDDELSNLLPLQSHEDLHFIGAGQPFRSGCPPFRKPKAAGLTIPWNGLVIDELALAVPERGPLRAGSHLVICKYSTHVCDRILEDRRSGKVIEVCAARRELQLTKDRVWIGGHITFKEDFNRRRDEGCGRDRRRVGRGRCIRNRRTEGDRGGKRDRRA